jgi:hypothetical protein
MLSVAFGDCRVAPPNSIVSLDTRWAELEVLAYDILDGNSEVAPKVTGPSLPFWRA